MDSLQNVPNHSDQMSKTTAWAVIIVLIVALGVGGYFLLKKGGTNTNNANTVVNLVTNNNSAFNINTFSDINVSMSDWLIYTNTGYGFTLRYPQSWLIEEKNPEGWFSGSKGIKHYFIDDKNSPLRNLGYSGNCFVVAYKLSDVNLDQWITDSKIYDSEVEGVQKSKSTNVNINNIQGIQVSEIGPNATKAESIYFKTSKAIVRYGYFTSRDIELQDVFIKNSAICKTISNSLQEIN